MNPSNSNTAGGRAPWREGSQGSDSRLMTCSTLTGDPVVNRDEETLGAVSDIMLDVQRGCVAYVVMASGGFMGVGERLFAVPWSALTIDAQRHRLVLDVDRAKLEKAPCFDRGRWPSEADERLVHDHYGTRPYWE